MGCLHGQHCCCSGLTAVVQLARTGGSGQEQGSSSHLTPHPRVAEPPPLLCDPIERRAAARLGTAGGGTRGQTARDVLLLQQGAPGPAAVQPSTAESTAQNRQPGHHAGLQAQTAPTALGPQQPFHRETMDLNGFLTTAGALHWEYRASVSKERNHGRTDPGSQERKGNILPSSLLQAAWPMALLHPAPFIASHR